MIVEAPGVLAGFCMYSPSPGESMHWAVVVRKPDGTFAPAWDALLPAGAYVPFMSQHARGMA